MRVLLIDGEIAKKELVEHGEVEVRPDSECRHHLLHGSPEIPVGFRRVRRNRYGGSADADGDRDGVYDGVGSAGIGGNEAAGRYGRRNWIGIVKDQFLVFGRRLSGGAGIGVGVVERVEVAKDDV